MNTNFDPRYVALVEHLASVRHNANITQAELADAFDQGPSWVADAESLQRPLEVVELFDWLSALGYCHKTFFTELGWFTPEDDSPALPIRGEAIPDARGVRVPMVWQGRIKEVLLEGITREGYLWLETEISALYAQLNQPRSKLKNRDAIARALELAINKFPRVNASDVFHHVVHRLYLREYTRTQADRSWQRAGSEALEQFIETRYGQRLAKRNITLRWLARPADRAAAFGALDLPPKAGRPPLALYGTANGGQHLFGAIFLRTEDAAASRALREQGLSSYLLTLDARSAPLPLGDLVNRGELGTATEPTDSRLAAASGFTASYSYNSRTHTGDGIAEATFDPKWDPFPQDVEKAWAKFRQEREL
ncbi:hypothetical protein AB4Z19_09545 [Pseudoduganella sp. RAF19]|uniref:hypothetical protein n=1 Tax=Pseudoduganella sp. RAF19 TaxID=3233052 RepID=UPI003F9B8259